MFSHAFEHPKTLWLEDVVVFNAVASACESAGEWRPACCVLDVLQSRRWSNQVSFATVTLSQAV